MKRRIGMILDQKFPTDVRVENEAMSLINAGFDVYLFCYAYGEEHLEEDYNGLKIRRIKASHAWIKRMRGLVNVIPVYENYLFKKIVKFINDNDIDFLHVHDLYLLGVCLSIKNSLGIAVISDLHENYVEGLKHYHFANSFPGNMLINLEKWERIEIDWLSRVDKIIVVVQEAVERLKSLGLDERKITVVENYLNYIEYERLPVQPAIVRRYGTQFVYSYIGGIDFHRGLHTVVDSLSKLSVDSLRIKFLIVGSGKILDHLRQKATVYDLGARIEFLGHQPYADLKSYVEISKIGVIPHLKTGHTDNTLPHKLFHYMYLKKPVLVSDCNPLKRIVESNNCGKVFKSGDADDLASKIEWFWQHRENLEIMGQNGYQALMNELNWKNAEERLIELYENF